MSNGISCDLAIMFVRIEGYLSIYISTLGNGLWLNAATSPDLAAPRMALALRGAAVLEVSAGTNGSVGLHPLPPWVLPRLLAYTGAKGVLHARLRIFSVAYCFSLGFGL